MALSFRLIHRSLNSFSIIRRSFAASPANPALSSSFSSSPLRVPSLSKQSLASLQWPLLLQSRQFRSFPVSLSSSSSSSSSEVRFEPNHNWSYEEFKPRELGIDAIEGCDFNHWLIVMDFPKEPRPSPEEMVRSYEDTCAKALDISVEEAKKKIYACSTSNYTGFHVEVTEIESEKFNGQPGVVFVLPDSYVDPEKKEYGGDKYINGVIIPRPRPTLNGKRNRDLPKHEQRARSIPNQQVNPSNGQEGPTPGGLKSNQLRNPSTTHQGPTPQSYPVKQSNGLPEGERRAPTNYRCQQNYGQPRLGEVYVHPENYVSPTPQNYSFGQNYNPLGQGERREHISMVAPAERNHYQPGNGGLIPSYSENYNQHGPGNFYTRDQRGFPLGDQRYYAPPSQRGDFRDDYRYYGPPQYRPYGYGVGGYQGQRPPEAYWQGPNSGCFQPGTMFSYMEGYPGHNQGQQFSQQAERNVQGANFYPQEQREFVQGYPSNHAPPRYQVHYRENNQNYVPAQETFYGGMGRYRGLGAPEAYWQGPNPRSVVQGTTCGYEQGYPEQIRSHSFSQEQPRNVQGVHYYSQEYREFPPGGHANYTPPRQQGYFRDDHQYYGPPQGAPYGHGVGEYQGHEASVAYWHGRKY